VPTLEFESRIPRLEFEQRASYSSVRVKGVLNLPAYRRLLAAYALNEVAWTLGSIALTLLVYRHGHSAVAAAAYFLGAMFVPSLISPAVVARLEGGSARGLLTALYAAETMAFLALALIARHYSLPAMLALTLLDGVLALSARSIARATTVAVLSPVGMLPEGNAMTNAVFSACFMVAPAVAGVSVATLGIPATLLVAGGAFGLIALVLLATPGLPSPSPARSPRAGRLQAALDYARRRPAVRTLLLLQGAATMVFTISVPVEIVLARHSLHTGDKGYGALISAWGVGAILGSLVYARWRRLSARTLISAGAVALGVGFALMAAAPSLGLALVGAAIAGSGNGMEAVAARTALQESLEAPWVMLVTSLNEAIIQAAPGGGIVIGGTVAALAGPRAAMAVAGCGALAISAVAWLTLAPTVPAVRPAARRAQRQPSA
jgi:Transmembrane secretion effector